MFWVLWVGKAVSVCFRWVWMRFGYVLGCREMDVMCAGCLSPLMCVAVCGALSGPDGVGLPAS